MLEDKVRSSTGYDIVGHRGFTCKLLRLQPHKHMIRMIMEPVQNRNFTLTTVTANLKVTTPEKWRSSEIIPGSLCFQYLHIRSPSNRLDEARLC